jgi:hypothetical protein
MLLPGIDTGVDPTLLVGTDDTSVAATLLVGAVEMVLFADDGAKVLLPPSVAMLLRAQLCSDDAADKG